MELKNETCKSCQKKLTPPCSSCNKLFSPADLNDGVCSPCQKIKVERELAQKRAAVKGDQLSQIILTTEASHNLEVIERLGIITAEAVIGTHILKDLFVGVRDVVGGRSGVLQKTLKEAREIVLGELKKEAHIMGGNAVVAIDLDYGEISSGGTMLMLVASGTVVKIK